MYGQRALPNSENIGQVSMYKMSFLDSLSDLSMVSNKIKQTC